MTHPADTESYSWHTPEEHDRWLGHLARATQRGDRAAQDALWGAVGQRLIRIAERHAWFLTKQEREDIAQETFPLFLILVHEWKSDADMATGFAQYLFGMFRARIHNLIRDGMRTRAVASLARREWDAPVVAGSDAGINLAAFFASLTAHERQMLLLRARDGLAFGEIATRLGVTPRSVSRTWNEMLRRLRRFTAA